MESAVSPFLMFEGHCEEALNLYISTIPNSRYQYPEIWCR
jgi:predicted 3-demethylubiquinone-9 3-methyltransferase (glyoxalase superfamily)